MKAKQEQQKITGKIMDTFLRHDDELGRLIEARSQELYSRLSKVNVDALGMPEHCAVYFKSSHSKRLFFSIETSAHILYRSITLTQKAVDRIVMMDYGAGAGTLFLLGKMIGCTVVYSDHLRDWQQSACLIAKAIAVDIDYYIVGDIDNCLDELSRLQLRCDVITSRNVVEHIYKLDEFYEAVHTRQLSAIVFSSTTANRQNPAVVLRHKMIHKRWEKEFRERRKKLIRNKVPGMNAADVQKLARLTQGLAVDDLAGAIDNFQQSGQLPDPEVYETNTCDPANGVWAENLLKQQAYRALINEQHYKVSFAPGFWDTHYKNSMMNAAAKILNRIIKSGGRLAMRLAPFMYVIAVPKKDA